MLQAESFLEMVDYNLIVINIKIKKENNNEK